MSSVVKDNLITKTKLTPKQAEFVKEYVKNKGNGSQAALVAYNTTKPDIAKTIASQNLSKLNVAEAIASACVEIQLTPARLLGRLNKILDQDHRTVSAAQVIIDMTGWRAAQKVDTTHRIGTPEEDILKDFS